MDDNRKYILISTHTKKENTPETAKKCLTLKTKASLIKTKYTQK